MEAMLPPLQHVKMKLAFFQNRCLQPLIPQYLALGLMFIAEGLLGVFLGRTVGGIIGWTGRLAQYTGGIFLLVAVFDSLQERSLEDVLSEMFKKPGELHASMFDNSLDGIILAVHEGPVLRANASASNMLGFDPAKRRQAAVEEIFDSVQSEYRRFRDELSVHGMARAEVAMTGESGIRFPAAVSAAVFKDSLGKKLEILTFKNISDRREAEEALRRSEARWNAAIDNFGEGAIIATEAEQVIYWNPAARAMHGLTDDQDGIEPLEEIPNTFELRTPDSLRLLTLDEWPMRRIKRGEPVRQLELRLRRPDQGWEKIVSYSGAMVKTMSGERLIFLSVYDLTDQRKAEMKLRESQERLKGSLAEKEVLLKEINGPEFEDFNKMENLQVLEIFSDYI